MPAEQHRKLAEMMTASTTQNGVVTTAQAVAMGVCRQTLSEMAKEGLLVREARGIYRVPSASTDRRQAESAAVAYTGGVLSHQSAAVGHDLTRTRPPRLDITVLRPKNPRSRPAWRIHRTWVLDDDELTTVNDLPITTVERTLLDLARPSYKLSDHRLRAMTSKALALRSFTSPGLAEYLTKRASRPGSGRLQVVLRELTGDDLDSVAESEFLELLRTAGVPMPALQHVVRDLHGDFVARVDMAWPDARIIAEVDGYSSHSEPRAFETDRSRGNVLLLMGWKVLRFTPKEVRRHPEDVAAAMCAALARPPESS
jgi:predicted transcriptional regulator of viral defense system